MKLKHFSLAAIAAAAIGSLAPSASADVITDWNLITVNATKAGAAPLNSNLASRIDAIEAIAVYDAVNSIGQFGTPYHYYSPNTGSAQAAAAQAAHDVLVNYFPSQQPALDAALASSLSSITDGPIGNGQTVGSSAAADIIALRASDGSAPNVNYTNTVTTPGAYQLTPNSPTVTSNFTFAAGINEQWGTVTPFILTNSSQFRPPPPPPVIGNSKAYILALNQSKTSGATNSPSHTAAQTDLANFYKQDAELTINEAARDLSLANNVTLTNNALLFALLDIAVADSRIAVWDAKYQYLYWRPITALNASPSGVVTNGYTAWQPTIVTPNHPDYPSGHSGTVTAGSEILVAFFGDVNTFTLHTTTAGESPRTLTSLSQLESDNGLSRIYGGIHYPFDNSEGQAVGALVAAYTLANGPHFNP